MFIFSRNIFGLNPFGNKYNSRKTLKNKLVKINVEKK